MKVRPKVMFTSEEGMATRVSSDEYGTGAWRAMDPEADWREDNAPPSDCGEDTCALDTQCDFHSGESAIADMEGDDVSG